jgi:hypothetical protein
MDEAKYVTIDAIIWGFFIVALTDSVYYEDEDFLQETRALLLGHSSWNAARRAIFSDDYRVYFTPDEAEWYAQLLSMLDFLMAIPFAQIHEVTHQVRQNAETNILEIAQAEKIDDEYRRRKVVIEDLAARSPSPENVGDEKIYHLVLREVTDILTAIRAGKAAVYFGYPVFEGTYSVYGGLQSSKPQPLDMTQRLVQARRLLDAIAGKGDLFVSWRLNKAPTFNSDVLLISLY